MYLKLNLKLNFKFSKGYVVEELPTVLRSREEKSLSIDGLDIHSCQKSYLMIKNNTIY